MTRRFEDYLISFRRIAGYCCFAAAALAPASSQGVPLTVDARANIFAAGQGAVPGGDGFLPPGFALPSGTNRILSFTGVTGLVDCVPIFSPRFGPDGSNCTGSAGTLILPANGIAGIRHDSRQMFLTGVFLDDTVPADPSPPSLMFVGPGASTFTELFPDLRQSFFIGDGLLGTGSGAQQLFYVPDDATRLFLGFADAFGFGTPFNNIVGLPPSSYLDNSGTISGSFSVSGAAIPEPSSGSLVGIAIALLVCWATRTRRSA